MNRQTFATVLTVPDADGWGRVEVAGAARLCYFLPARWPTVVVGDRVTVESMGEHLTVVHRLGAA